MKSGDTVKHIPSGETWLVAEVRKTSGIPSTHKP